MEADAVTDHYSFGGLRSRIEQGLAQLGEAPTVETLAPVDEFHIGGRAATGRLVEQLGLSAGERVLDVGSGLGGTARYIANEHEVEVMGVDLTAEYVDTATWLTGLVGLASRVRFECASALDVPCDDGAFDAVTMVHVGMNIGDKVALCREAARVLRPGGRFAIYDIMRTGDGELAYPVPWAASAATSALATADDYAAALRAADFEISAINDRRAGALQFFDHLAAASRGQEGSAALGLHLVMGPDTPTKLQNMIAGVRAGVIAPTEIIVRH